MRGSVRIAAARSEPLAAPRAPTCSAGRAKDYERVWTGRTGSSLSRMPSAVHFLAGRAFDAVWLLNDLLNRGIIPVMSPKLDGKFSAQFDEETCKWRHLIKNYFGELKDNIGVAMRSYKKSTRASKPLSPQLLFTHGKLQQSQ